MVVFVLELNRASLSATFSSLLDGNTRNQGTAVFEAFCSFISTTYDVKAFLKVIIWQHTLHHHSTL